MKKVIVKRFTPTSVFKTVAMAVAIPFMLFFCIAVLISLFGINSNGVNAFAVIFPFIIMPIIYGLVFMLFAASYNWLAPKFGGLELEIEDGEVIHHADLPEQYFEKI